MYVEAHDLGHKAFNGLLYQRKNGIRLKLFCLLICVFVSLSPLFCELLILGCFLSHKVGEEPGDQKHICTEGVLHLDCLFALRLFADELHDRRLTEEVL